MPTVQDEALEQRAARVRRGTCQGQAGWWTAQGFFYPDATRGRWPKDKCICGGTGRHERLPPGEYRCIDCGVTYAI